MLYDVDALPVVPSPMTIVEDYNKGDRGAASLHKTDNLISPQYFDRETKQPLPYSMSKSYMFHAVVNNPPTFIDCSVMDTLISTSQQRALENFPVVDTGRHGELPLKRCESDVGQAFRKLLHQSV
jgi:hypothetical protein